MAIPKKISFFSPIHQAADLTPNLPQPPYDFYPTPSRSFGFNKTLVVIAEELEGSKLIIRNRFNLKLVKVSGSLFNHIKSKYYLFIYFVFKNFILGIRPSRLASITTAYNQCSSRNLFCSTERAIYRGIFLPRR